MTCSVLVGGEWGDEGKGKCITYLCHVDKPDIVARAGVGPNAGHTVEYKGKKYAVRLTPSGFIHKDAKLLIGAGVLIDPEVFLHEMEYLKEYEVDKRTFIDYRCAVIEKKHKELDRKSSHLSEKIGTTGTGCGPANADRVMRKAKLAKQISELSKYLTNVAEEINEAIDNDKDVIIEGSQGFGLSLYYGTYPYVTSKDTTASSAAADVGVGPTKIDEVIVVLKHMLQELEKDHFQQKLAKMKQKKWESLNMGQ